MFDIIIIGGGLTGLTAAIALSKHGLKIAIIEKNDLSKKNISDRTITLSVGTILFYKKIGIDINIENAGKIETIFITDHNGFGNATFEAIEIGQDYMGYVVKNNEIIDNLISNLGNITLFDKNSNYNIEKIDNRFEVKLDNQTIYSKIAIVSDGIKSSIFDMLDFEKTNIGYNQTALMFNIKHANRHNNTATEHFTPNGPFATLPLNDPHQSGIVWSQNTAINSIFDEKKLSNDMQEYIPKWLGEASLITKVLQFPLSMQIAKKYYKNGVFLLGATARNLHPLAGQAFNVIVQDIDSLADILGDWHKNGDYDLHNYAIKWRCKRIISGFGISCFTHLTNSAFSNNSSALHIARNAALFCADSIGCVRRFLIRHSSGV